MIVASKQSFLNNDNNRAKIIHQWDFRKSDNDVITGNAIYLYNSPLHTTDGIKLSGSSQYINLGSNLIPQTESGCTIEVVSAKHSEQL